MDGRTHQRLPATFQVRVTELAAPELSASGEAIDISESGIGVYLPLRFPEGSPVRLNIKDSVLFGFIAYSIPERSFFRTGIEVVQVLVGTSDLAQLLRAMIAEKMPNVELEYSRPN